MWQWQASWELPAAQLGGAQSECVWHPRPICLPAVMRSPRAPCTSDIMHSSTAPVGIGTGQWSSATCYGSSGRPVVACTLCGSAFRSERAWRHQGATSALEVRQCCKQSPSRVTQQVAQSPPCLQPGCFLASSIEISSACAGRMEVYCTWEGGPQGKTAPLLEGVRLATAGRREGHMWGVRRAVNKGRCASAALLAHSLTYRACDSSLACSIAAASPP